MSGLTTRVRREGFVERQKALMARLEQYGQLGSALESLGAIGVARYATNIAGGRSAYHRFPKLSPRYAAWKAKRYPGRPILMLTGGMVDGLGYRVIGLGTAHYVLHIGVGGVDEKGVSNGLKATWHMEGTPRMPPRKFAALGKRFLDEEFVAEFKARLRARTPVHAA